MTIKQIEIIKQIDSEVVFWTEVVFNSQKRQLNMYSLNNSGGCTE